MLRLCVVTLIIAASLVACSRWHATTQPRATRSPAPAPTASTRRPTPQALAPATPLARRPPVHSPSPVPAAPTHAPFAATLPFLMVTPQPRPAPQRSFTTLPPVPIEAPDVFPRIIDVIMPVRSVTGGESVTGDVIASSNVASVEVRIANFARPMEKIAPGVFTLTLTVPKLPFFLRHRTYALSITARNTRGDAVTQTIAILVR